jgi:hypothetical protein
MVGKVVLLVPRNVLINRYVVVIDAPGFFNVGGLFKIRWRMCFWLTLSVPVILTHFLAYQCVESFRETSYMVKTVQ